MKIFNILEVTPPAELTEVTEAASTSELLNGLIDKAVSFGLKLLAAFAIYFVGRWIIKKVKKLLNKVFEKKGTDAAISSFVQSIVSIALTIVLVIITVGAIGIDTSSIAALLAGGGLAIGMALNGTVQNFAGGIMIILFRPFRSGDFIEAQGFMGTVTDVTITSTKLLTVDNKVVIIPNGNLSSGTINNYSHMPLRRLDLNVNVEYGVPSAKVNEALMTIINTDSRILDSSVQGAADPFVALAAMCDSSVQYVIRVWVKSEDYWGVNFDLLDKIYNELPKNGINFPFPQLDVTINQK